MNTISKWSKFMKKIEECHTNSDIQKLPDKYGWAKNMYLMASYYAKECMSDEEFAIEHGISIKRVDNRFKEKVKEIFEEESNGIKI